MKKIVIIISSLLTGCSYLTRYDPFLEGAYIDASVAINKLHCDANDNWTPALDYASRMHEIAKFRIDPQLETTEAIIKNLNSAKENQSTCNRYLDVAKIRMSILMKAWRSR